MIIITKSLPCCLETQSSTNKPVMLRASQCLKVTPWCHTVDFNFVINNFAPAGHLQSDATMNTLIFSISSVILLKVETNDTLHY